MPTPSTVSRDCIRFELVGYGESARAIPEHADRLWLDVGNELRPGVVDQHQLAAYAGSTVSLVLAHRELVLSAVSPARAPHDPFLIVLHEYPDLDAVAAAFLAVELLTRGTFPEGSDALAAYVDSIDQGYSGVSQDNPFSLYSAFMLVAHRLAQRTWHDLQQQWRRTIEEGLEVVGHALERMITTGASLDEVDAFDAPGIFGPQDRRDVMADLARYERKLADPATHARRLRMKLPGQLGGSAEVDALLVRDVQNADDPERVMLFKDWARTDRRRSSGGGGFAALSVFHTHDGPKRRRRCIVSVRPDSRRSLKGLGAVLDQAEAEARGHIHGVDDRVEDPVTHERKEARSGYGNSDPWYDGRSHGYTIVDSPRSGTVLDADTIERLFVEHGQRSQADAARLELPQPGDLDASRALDPAALVRLTTVVQAQRATAGTIVGSSTPPPDVFISYPRTKLGWVQEHIYAPLAKHGRYRVFFDKDSLKAGMLWPAELADAVERCSLFLAVYCADYFRSSFCQWELQLAIVRDPIANKRIILPVCLEDVSLPSYCSLVQAHRVPSGAFADEIVRLVNERLAR